MRMHTPGRSCLLVLASLALGAAAPHNSEEHKLIADRGAAQVVIPPSVRLPEGVAFVVPDRPAAREHAWLTVTPGVASQTGWMTLNWDGPSGQYDFVALYQGTEMPKDTNGYIKTLLPNARWQWAVRGNSYVTGERFDPSKEYWIAYIAVNTSARKWWDPNCNNCPRSFRDRHRLHRDVYDDGAVGVYAARFEAAKKLAVGFAGNVKYPSTPLDMGGYDEQARCQDNTYWHGYGQRDSFNIPLWIPPQDLAPARVLTVRADAGGTACFTFGELVAIYGDYRRTVHRDPSGRCCLSPNDKSEVRFAGNVVANADKYRPSPVSTARYLQSIGSGLVPPYGSAGNEFANSVSGEANDGSAGWWGDEMMRIANVNDWHFSNAAVAWYVGMHRLALQCVERAQETGDPTYWEHALHYEANALHSLTDLFAYGHVVVNADETSYETIEKAALTSDARYGWMQRILAVGGGSRVDGRVILAGLDLPTIPSYGEILKNEARNDGIASYRKHDPQLSLEKKQEHDDHDGFNSEGALVRNLMGTSFRIGGDFKLRSLGAADREVASTAVTVSLQSLFDAYVALEASRTTVEELGASGSPYFGALKYIPVFITDGRYKGRWARYAGAVDDITGAGVVPSSWESCQLPYIGGRRKLLQPNIAKSVPLPDPDQAECTSFPGR